MAKLDAMQLIKEKRQIDDIMKCDDKTIEDFVAMLDKAIERFRTKEQLKAFCIGGIWFLSAFYEFVYPLFRLISLFKEKYPHALYISWYKQISNLKPEEMVYSCIRLDEIYDGLGEMDLSAAAEVIDVMRFPDKVKEKLLNALSTESKKEFLDLLGQQNLSKVILQAFKIAHSCNAYASTMDSVGKAREKEKVTDEEIKYGVLEVFSRFVKELLSKNEFAEEKPLVGDAELIIELIDLLVKNNDSAAQLKILSEGYDAVVWVEIADSMIYYYLELTRFYFEFLNDYEKSAVDNLMCHRDGTIKFDDIQPNGNRQTISLRNRLDRLLGECPYNQPIEIENAETPLATATYSDKHTPLTLTGENRGFANYYLMVKPERLTIDRIISIAKELSGQSLIGTKKIFIDPEDVNTFCWFFNGGQSDKEIDFARKIQWHGTAASLKYLVALMYGASNSLQMNQFKMQDGALGCLANVFDYKMRRGPGRIEESKRIRQLKNAKAENADPDDKKLLMEIIGRNVPWPLNFKGFQS